MKRKKYTPEFKLKIVKEAIETGNSSFVVRNHQLGSSMVSRWVRQYKAAGESNFLAEALKCKQPLLMVASSEPSPGQARRRFTC